MAKDFFGNLSDTFAKAARDLSDKAGSIYEVQKLKNKISGEERQIEKTFADLGRIVYRRYKDGIPVEEAEDELCSQIEDRYQEIERLKKESEEAKEQKKCPVCGSTVGKYDAFCSKCGASCSAPEEETEDTAVPDEPEEETGEVTEETTEEPEEEEIPEWKPEEHTGSPVSLEKPGEGSEEDTAEETKENTEEDTDRPIELEDVE